MCDIEFVWLIFGIHSISHKSVYYPLFISKLNSDLVILCTRFEYFIIFYSTTRDLLFVLLVCVIHVTERAKNNIQPNNVETFNSQLLRCRSMPPIPFYIIMSSYKKYFIYYITNSSCAARPMTNFFYNSLTFCSINLQKLIDEIP